MAKGCMYYIIQECDGGPWKTMTAPMRATPAEIHSKYEEHCRSVDPKVSVRLAEVRVINQRNGVTQNMP